MAFYCAKAGELRRLLKLLVAQHSSDEHESNQTNHLYMRKMLILHNCEKCLPADNKEVFDIDFSVNTPSIVPNRRDEACGSTPLPSSGIDADALSEAELAPEVLHQAAAECVLLRLHCCYY